MHFLFLKYIKVGRANSSFQVIISFSSCTSLTNIISRCREVRGKITPNIKKYGLVLVQLSITLSHTHTRHTHMVKLIYIVATLRCSCSKNLCLYIKSTLRVLIINIVVNTRRGSRRGRAACAP